MKIEIMTKMGFLRIYPGIGELCIQKLLSGSANPKRGGLRFKRLSLVMFPKKEKEPATTYLMRDVQNIHIEPEKGDK